MECLESLFVSYQMVLQPCKHSFKTPGLHTIHLVANEKTDVCMDHFSIGKLGLDYIHCDSLWFDSQLKTRGTVLLFKACRLLSNLGLTFRLSIQYGQDSGVSERKGRETLPSDWLNNDVWAEESPAVDNWGKNLTSGIWMLSYILSGINKTNWQREKSWEKTG